MIAWLRNPWGRPRLLPLITVAVHRLVDRAGRDRDPVRLQRRPLAHDLAGLLVPLVHGRRRAACSTIPPSRGRSKHTLVLAVICVAVATPLGVALALGLQRWRGRGGGTVNTVMLLPLVTPEIVMGVALLLLFLQSLPGDRPRDAGPGDRAGHVHALLRRRDRARPARLDRPRVRGGGGRSRRAAARPALPRRSCRCSRRRSSRAPRSSSRSRSTTSSSRSTSRATPSTTTVSMLLYASARGAPTPALNALATVALVITLVTLALAFLVYRRFAGGGEAAAVAALEICDGGRGQARGADEALRRRRRRRRDRPRTCRPGEFFTLLGPSGCGKTTTLRMIAGFERPTSGRILLDGTDVAQVPPHKRNVNTVFQSYALFPHLDVADNVAFGLKYQKHDEGGAAPAGSRACSSSSGSSGFEQRKPEQLSGGQQQRVALARALILRAARAPARRAARRARRAAAQGPPGRAEGAPGTTSGSRSCSSRTTRRRRSR